MVRGLHGVPGAVVPENVEEDTRQEHEPVLILHLITSVVMDSVWMNRIKKLRDVAQEFVHVSFTGHWRIFVNNTHD